MTIPPETERLIFRDWIAAELKPLYSVCSNPSVRQFVGEADLKLCNGQFAIFDTDTMELVPMTPDADQAE